MEGADAGLLGPVKPVVLRQRRGGRDGRACPAVPGLVLGVKGYGAGQVQHPSCCLLPGSNHQTQDFILIWGWLSPQLLSLFFFPPSPHESFTEGMQ